MRFPFYPRATGGRYPNTNFNNVNLDWMLKQLKKIDDIKEAAAAAKAATQAAQAATAAATAATAAAQSALDTAEAAADNSVSFAAAQTKTAAEKERARRNSGQHDINVVVAGQITAASEAAAAAQATADSALDSVDRTADLSITIGNASHASTLSVVGSICILSLSVNVTDAIRVNTWTTLGQLPAGVVPVATTLGLGRRGLASTYSPLMARVTTNRNIQVSLDYAFDGTGSTSIRAVIIFAIRRT